MSTAPREPRISPTGFLPYGVLGDLPVAELAWQDDALCAETDPETFFPEKGGSTKEAKAVCVECIVRAECLEYALATLQQHGVWGGRSERERRRLLGLVEDDAEEASAA